MAKSFDQLLGRMQSLAEQTSDKSFAGLIYGGFGSGKTVLAVGLARYLAEGKEVLYIDSSDGWVSLENHPELIDDGLVTRFPFQSQIELIALAAEFASGNKKLDRFGAVVVDEISSTSDISLDEVIRRAESLTASEQIVDFDPKVYKPMGDDNKRFITGIKRAGRHLILTAHERVDKDHRGVKVTGPSLSPQNNKGIQQLMHVTAHMTNEITGEGKNVKYNRKLQAHPSQLVAAKSRIGGLPMKSEPKVFVQAIKEWVDNGAIELAEESNDLIPDDLPEEGVPVSEERDDEPAFAEEV